MIEFQKKAIGIYDQYPSLAPELGRLIFQANDVYGIDPEVSASIMYFTARKVEELNVWIQSGETAHHRLQNAGIFSNQILELLGDEITRKVLKVLTAEITELLPIVERSNHTEFPITRQQVSELSQLLDGDQYDRDLEAFWAGTLY